MTATSSHITFDNGFTAELIRNTHSGLIVRLYAPSDLFVSSVQIKNEADFQATAIGLLHGYFSGWRDCKRNVELKINEALRPLSVPQGEASLEEGT